MAETRIERVTARVVPVRADGRVLLLQGHDPARPDEPYWFTIGGGVDEGESLAEAAARELREETGIVLPVEAFGQPCHVGRHDFTYNGVAYTAHSTFFAVALEGDVEVSFDGIEPGEVISDAAWWAPEEVVAQGVSNLHLPDIMKEAVEMVRASSSLGA